MEIIKNLFPLNEIAGAAPLESLFSIFFYTAIALFIFGCLFDLALKAIRRLFRREHKEHKFKRTAKKILNISIIVKLFYLVVGLFVVAFKALAISEWLRKFIAEPESVISLIKGNWLFFAVLGCLLLFRRKRSPEL